MSDQILFDKLIYLDRLKAAGIPEEQARAHAEAMHEALRESVATSADLAELRTDMRQELAAVRTDMRQELALVRTDLLALDHRLTVRGGLMSAAIVAILASIKFFG
jgi:hypothetical protein